VIAGTGLQGGGTITGSVTVSIANTGVSAAEYELMKATINAQGQITSATARTIAYPISIVADELKLGYNTSNLDLTANELDLKNTGVAASVYSLASFSVDEKGRITWAQDGQTIPPLEIDEGDLRLYYTNNLDLTADELDLADTAVTPASYKNADITVDQKGRLTAAQNGSVEYIYDVGDETTDMTTGENKKIIRIPVDMTLSEVRASVASAPTGSEIIIDVGKVNPSSSSSSSSSLEVIQSTSIFSTKITIDEDDRTSTTASVPAIISDSTIVEDEEFAIHIDQIGSTIAGAGLKLTFIGTRS